MDWIRTAPAPDPELSHASRARIVGIGADADTGRVAMVLAIGFGMEAVAYLTPKDVSDLKFDLYEAIEHNKRVEATRTRHEED